jgi:hypothetical protein
MVWWSGCAVIAFIAAIFVEEDLRRLKLDEVKNSEYIEEEDVRRQSFEQRELFLKEAGLQGNMRF